MNASEIIKSIEAEQLQVAEGTVRICAYAFAGSDVEMVKLPYSVTAIGHKAFFGCDKLDTVSFGSYKAPILEEEYDPAYYESMKHMPGTGDFGTYTDYVGNQVQINGMGLLNIYIRYKLLHKGKLIFRLENCQPHGACVTIGEYYGQ